jgi:hypothetical protein
MTIVKLENHPEALALAGFELATGRIERAVAMVRHIGTDDKPRGDDARRKLAAGAAREAARYLESAAAMLEAGL